MIVMRCVCSVCGGVVCGYERLRCIRKDMGYASHAPMVHTMNVIAAAMSSAIPVLPVLAMVLLCLCLRHGVGLCGLASALLAQYG